MFVFSVCVYFCVYVFVGVKCIFVCMCFCLLSLILEQTINHKKKKNMSKKQPLERPNLCFSEDGNI
jgi:hypothetical protein